LNTRRLATVSLVAALAASTLGAPPASAKPSETNGAGHGSKFVRRVGSKLVLGGKEFRFGGSNNYYLMYKSPLMVDDVLNDAKAAEFTVIRHWGFLEIGDPVTGEGSIRGKADGIYLQYWDAAAGRPAYNDGADGMQKIDYILWKAGQLGLKVVIPLTNNWGDFGGMDQYVRWRGGQYHDDFYTDPTIRQWYKDWISHVLNRVNPLTGLAYKNDPTVMTWELGNEPRCIGSGTYPRSPNCSTTTLTTWADEMTRHIKSIDRNHLASVGDEGFYCDDPQATDWTLNCGEGVDSVALAKLPAVDVSSYHLYPDHWGKDPAWGTAWIKRHIRTARHLGKPSMLGEFGYLNKATRNHVWREWTDTVVREGGSGFLYWILSGIQDDGTLYPDYDGFTVYCPSPVCTTVTNASRMIRGRDPNFPPVADNDTAVVEFGQPATLPATANDLAYRASVDAASVDLDPAAAGRQSTVTVAAGQFTVDSAGVVTFTPAAGFAGRATAAYVVKDTRRRLSNPATLTVTVKPDPTAAVTLYSFETGVEGWAPGNWLPDSGSVAQSTDFATAGAHSLRVDSTVGHWFGTATPASVDLTGKSAITFDLRTGATGTSVSLAFWTGPSFTWCQSTWGFTDANTTRHVELGLFTELAGCDPAALTDVRGVFLWFSTGTFHLDNLQAV
jgi:mannan endo-1,4-beta-mannosidase